MQSAASSCCWPRPPRATAGHGERRCLSHHMAWRGSGLGRETRVSKAPGNREIVPSLPKARPGSGQPGKELRAGLGRATQDALALCPLTATCSALGKGRGVLEFLPRPLCSSGKGPAWQAVPSLLLLLVICVPGGLSKTFGLGCTCLSTGRGPFCSRISPPANAAWAFICWWKLSFAVKVEPWPDAQVGRWTCVTTGRAWGNCLPKLGLNQGQLLGKGPMLADSQSRF